MTVIHCHKQTCQHSTETHHPSLQGSEAEVSKVNQLTRRWVWNGMSRLQSPEATDKQETEVLNTLEPEHGCCWHALFTSCHASQSMTSSIGSTFKHLHWRGWGWVSSTTKRVDREGFGTSKANLDCTRGDHMGTKVRVGSPYPKQHPHHACSPQTLCQ